MHFTNIGRFGGFLLMSVVAACNQSPEGNQLRKLEAAKSGWNETAEKDPMTDKVFYRLYTRTLDGTGILSYNCSDNGIGAFVVSDIFLANDQRGDVMLRFDEEKPHEAFARLKGNAALFPVAHHEAETSRLDVDRAMVTLSASLFLADSLRPMQKMRIRLTNSDGESRHLTFDVSELSSRLRKLEDKCGYVGDIDLNKAHWKS